jgi:hypothetical protein
MSKRGISIARGAKGTSKTREQRWARNNNGEQ